MYDTRILYSTVANTLLWKILAETESGAGVVLYLPLYPKKSLRGFSWSFAPKNEKNGDTKRQARTTTQRPSPSQGPKTGRGLLSHLCLLVRLLLHSPVHPSKMGCAASQEPYVANMSNGAKNEVDEQLAKMQEEERTHYKVSFFVCIQIAI